MYHITNWHLVSSPFFFAVSQPKGIGLEWNRAFVSLLLFTSVFCFTSQKFPTLFSCSTISSKNAHKKYCISSWKCGTLVQTNLVRFLLFFLLTCLYSSPFLFSSLFRYSIELHEMIQFDWCTTYFRRVFMRVGTSLRIQIEWTIHWWQPVARLARERHS
jgi:hypothetical protein